MTPDELDFFNALSDVVYGNPYTEERVALIRRLAPNAPGDLSRNREALAHVVAPRLNPYLQRPLSDEERQVLEPALLYVIYHRLVPQLDAHIERQATQSGAPLAVPFGDDALGALVQNG